MVLTLADIDHRLNQLWNCLRKLESDVSSICTYVNSLSNKTITPIFIDAIDFKSMLKNIKQ